jgi:hypothetical protein
MASPYRTASPRALATMRATVQELADRKGVPVREVYDELGAYDSTPWGQRMRVLTAPLVAAMTSRARQELDTLTVGTPTTLDGVKRMLSDTAGPYRPPAEN